MTAVVALQHMTSAVIIRTLLDYDDHHSPECKSRADALIAKLQTNLYTAVSTDLLDLFVDSYPRQLPAFLLPVLAPPHLRTLRLKGCSVLQQDSQQDYKHLKETLIKCSKLRFLILDGCNLTSPLLLADVIIQHASQLTSISVEECQWVSDEFIQKLLRGLPSLSYLNISVCPEVTDRVFALTDTQGLLEERDAFASGCNLSSVDLSGNQQLTSTCIRHLTELCGPKLRNVSVAATRMDCTILWFLSGYSLSTAVQLAAEANKAIMNGDLASGETLSQLISEFRLLQDKLKSLQEEECQEGIEDGQVGENENEDWIQGMKDLKVEMDDGEKVNDGEKVGNTPEKSHVHESCESLHDACEALEIDKERELQTSGRIHSKIENGAESILESKDEATQEELRTDGYCRCLSNVDEVLHDTEQPPGGKQHENVVEWAESTESRDQAIQEANRIAVFRRSGEKGKQESTAGNLEAFGSFQDKYNVEMESEAQRCKEGIYGQDSGRIQVDKAELGMGISLVQRSKNAEMLDCIKGRTENESPSEDWYGTELTIVYDTAEEINGQPVEGDDLKEKKDSEVGFARSSEDGLNAQLKLFVYDVIENSCKRLIQDVDATSGMSRQLSSSSQSQAHAVPETCASSVQNIIHLHKTEHSADFCLCGHELARKRSEEACLDTSATDVDKDCKTEQRIASGAGSNGNLQHPEPVQTSTTYSLCKLNSEDMTNEHESHDLLQAISASESSDPNHDSEYSCETHYPSTSQFKDANALSKADSTSDNSSNKKAHKASTASEMLDNEMDALYPWRRLYTPCILSLDMTIIDFDATLVMMCLQEFFQANTHLKKLNVCWKELTDLHLEIVATGVELQSLCLIDCSSLTSLGIAHLLSWCRNLQRLDLQGLCYITDAALIPLFTQGDSCNMQSLKLSETNITDATLSRIAEVLGKKITELEISWCEEITDYGVAKIAQHCSSLQTLTFRQCSVSADTLMSLAWNCNSLTYLNMSGVENLTDGVVKVMMPCLRLLAKLDVSWNSDLTNTAVSCIMSCCPLLVELYLMGLKGITEQPFMPMISELGKWQRCKRLIQLKMKERTLLKKLEEEQLSSDEEYEDLFCPVRSTSYAPCLRILELQYCDHVNDDLLAELVAICMGQLSITDYYAMEIKPKLLRFKVAGALPD